MWLCTLGGVCQWDLNDPYRTRQAWISLFPLPLQCSLSEREQQRTIEWFKFIRVDIDCHVYLNLRGGNGKQESAEREKMTEKKRI